MLLRFKEVLYTILTVFIVLFSTELHAQCTIDGRVLDVNNNPLEFAEVILLSKDSIPIMSELTSETGEFKVNSGCGEFTVVIIQIGSKLFEEKINVTDAYKFDDIIVKSGIVLDEVVVSTQKTILERKIDRLVFNVGSSSIASGGSILDALKLTPGVAVQGDAIAIIGKSNVGVLLNGRLSQLSGDELANFLKSIPIDDIESIEVITTPPAKYEAEGNSGLINIVYKTGRNNYWNNQVRLSYLQTTYPGLLLGNTFNYSKDKFSLSLGLTAKTGDIEVVEENTVFYPNSTWSSNTERKDKQDFLAGNLNLKYRLSDRTSIGAQYLTNIAEPNIQDNNVIRIVESNDNNIFNSSGLNEATKIIHSANAHLTHSIDTLGKYFEIYFDYFTFDKDQERLFNSFNNSDSITNNNLSLQKIENYSGKIDFVHPTGFFNLGYGAKYSYTSNISEVSFSEFEEGKWIVNSLLSDNFEYTESNIAAYIEGDKQLSDKVQIKLGLRYENTSAEGYSVTYDRRNTNDYYKFFPTANLQYAINDKNSLTLSYSKRINRPSFWDLNPFRWYFNQFSYSEGNPFLNPSFTDNFELTHAYNNNFFTTLFVSQKLDGFSQFPTVDPISQEQIFSRANFFDTYNMGTAFTYVLAKYDWWQSYNQLYLYYSHSKFNEGVDLNPENGIGTYIGSNNSFVLNKENTINAELSLWYQGTNRAILYEVGDSYSVDFGFKFFALQRKVVMSLSVNDIFKSSAATYRTEFNNILQESFINYDTRRLNIAVSYKFGNDKINSTNVKIGNEEEKARLGN